MSEIMVAVYENGVLRPLNPVTLTEGQTVRLRVVSEVALGNSNNEVEAAIQTLVDRGKMTLPAKDPSIKTVSELERSELFEKLKERPGKPLSEIIIEDRGQW